jgi:ABC-type branched-subunit amino acid transport system substrate-binding protein
MQEHMAEVGPAILGLKGMVRIYTKTLEYPANRKFVPAMIAKTGKPPEELHGCAYTSMSIYLAGLEATGGDARLEVLRPAILKVKLEDTPTGPVSFTSNGFAVTNRHLVEAVMENNEYVWKVLKVYKNVRDPRDDG